jgi:hypothetical protein
MPAMNERSSSTRGAARLRALAVRSLAGKSSTAFFNIGSTEEKVE